MTNQSDAFEVQGHRGARGLAPENTLAGFERALAIGVDALELDVGLTWDRVVVISHDLLLNPDVTRIDGRWLDAPGPSLRSLNFGDLQKYDVGRIRPGSRYAGRFPHQTPADGERVPALRDLFDLVRRTGNHTVRFSIEAKIDPTKPETTYGPEEFATAILSIVEEAKMTDRVIIQSFDWRVLLIVEEKAPNIVTAYLSAQQSWLDNIQAGEPGPSPWTAGLDIDDYDGSVPRLVKAAGGDIWSPFYRDVDAVSIETAHKAGLKVIVWTANKPDDMKSLILMGVDGIITDYPDRLNRVLKDLGREAPRPVSPPQ